MKRARTQGPLAELSIGEGYGREAPPATSSPPPDPGSPQHDPAWPQHDFASLAAAYDRCMVGHLVKLPTAEENARFVKREYSFGRLPRPKNMVAGVADYLFLPQLPRNSESSDDEL